MKYVFHTAGKIRDAYDFVYDNLAVLLDYLYRVNDDGTEENIGAVETGREEPCRTPYRGC